MPALRLSLAMFIFQSVHKLDNHQVQLYCILMKLLAVELRKKEDLSDTVKVSFKNSLEIHLYFAY